MESLQNIRHSTAHLLAAAVAELYPDAKPTIGPAIENGFYYDFEFQKPISDADLPKIESKMLEILPSWTLFSSREVTEEEARKMYSGNSYKLELIDEIVKKGEKITLYKSGEFEDLCRGGHSNNPSADIGALKLLSLAGAYWRGDEKNPMLTRIYGTAFPTQDELDQYLTLLEEAKKRDHKKLGKELDLFLFHETSPGMAYWLPKGLVLYNTLYNLARSMYEKFDYKEVATPMLNKKELFETSGHWQHYREDMFVSPMSYLTGDSTDPYEGAEVFGIKPMNCPNAMTIFGSTTRSHHDLPLRLADTSLLHRYELSGTLNGLFRIRQFRQDDAHIFILPQQSEEEFSKIMQMVEEMYAPFGLSYQFRLGTRPEKALGEASDWDYAESTLREVLKKSGKPFFEVAGEGAFYGPKVDILMKDSLGREWQTGTIQLDIQQPKRFGLEYIDNDGKPQMPFVFHRAIYGSFERFLGILIEHYAGAFPTWLAPIQVQIMPVSDKFVDFSRKVTAELKSAGIRSEADFSNNTLGAKIREATLQKVPFMCIIGGQEEEKSTDGNLMVTVRERGGKNLGMVEVKEFIKQIQQKIETKQ